MHWHTGGLMMMMHPAAPAVAHPANSKMKKRTALRRIVLTRLLRFYRNFLTQVERYLRCCGQRTDLWHCQSGNQEQMKGNKHVNVKNKTTKKEPKNKNSLLAQRENTLSSQISNSDFCQRSISMRLCIKYEYLLYFSSIEFSTLISITLRNTMDHYKYKIQLAKDKKMHEHKSHLQRA